MISNRVRKRSVDMFINSGSFECTTMEEMQTFLECHKFLVDNYKFEFSFLHGENLFSATVMGGEGERPTFLMSLYALEAIFHLRSARSSSKCLTLARLCQGNWHEPVGGPF
ncbi:hypothetical protein J1N35_021486 [Gossypium stocksii]|uniref:Uncharacterized protein n=1 Tax=Gossypium stocksii TaxID=47602 RepID=A0A9D3VEA2_9ROSI|nr:hypothetical protein J1N35_021486 [Gossypium stocksii]